MRKIYLILLLVLITGFSLPLTAQVGKGGYPLSSKLTDKVMLKEVPFEIMPSVDVEALKKEDVYNDQLKDQPWRFGQNITVSLNPKNSGVWDKLEDGNLWRLGIISKGAQTINLTFDNYRLPEGATLFIYTADKSEILGAFTTSNNQDDRYFATTLLRGESIILEYFEPANVDFPGELNLWRVTHGYRGIVDYEKTFGESGICNINAVCSQGDPIDNQIRSVGMLVSGGNGFCTGTMINNTNIDGTPYLLTANHCYTAPGTVVFWFNWQSATCSNPGSSPAYNSLSGATDKARYATSDFWLMQLNSTPPAGYNVYYSGWNHTTNSSITTKVWCVHHPRGDIKKISWCNAGVTTSEYLGDPASGTDHWRVGSWSDGTTTEPGSSGSPLFDTQGRIIGQLHGGYAACLNTEPDYYGKLGTSWTGGGTNSTRLSNWLDPGNTGVTTLEGYDPDVITYDDDAQITSILSPVKKYYSLKNITPSVVIKNNGNNVIDTATISYELDGAAAVVYGWSGNLNSGATRQIDFDEIPLTVGDHTFIARIEIPNDEEPLDDTASVEFTVLDCYGAFPVIQGFNATTIDECWTIADVTNTAGEITFVTSGTNPSCTPSEGTHMLRFNSNSASSGSQVSLSSFPVSTLGFDSITVSFDWHQDAALASDSDMVSLQYSFDGDTWANVQDFYRYNGTTTGWQSKSVLMPTAIDNKPDVYFALLFTSAYGNNCHLDDLAIDATPIEEPYPDFTATPLSTVIEDTIVFTDASVNGPFTYYDWNFGEGAVPATDTGIGPHKIVYTSEGLKTVSLMVDSAITKTKTSYISIFQFDAPTELYGIALDDDVQLNWNPLFFGDFESGDFSEWDEVIQGPGTIGDYDFPFWFITDTNAFRGNYGAQVSWGYNINTWMISPVLHINDGSMLTYIWASSYYWHVDPFQNGELTVEVSTDGGSTWDPVWNFTEIGEWENWLWYITGIDLSAYAGDDIQIAFHMVGNNNADVNLDDVFITSGNKARLGTHAIGSPALTDQSAKSLRQSGFTFAPLAKAPTLVNYSVYRDAALVGSTAEATYLDETLANGLYTYYVTANYTSPAGISEPSNSIEVRVGPESVNPAEKQVVVKLYPNPSQGLFNIEADHNYHLTVLNLTGSIVGEFEINSSTQVINLSDKQKGLYILKFSSDENTFEIKALIR